MPVDHHVDTEYGVLHTGNPAYQASSSAHAVHYIVADSTASCQNAHVHSHSKPCVFIGTCKIASGAAHAGNQLWRQKEAARLGEEIAQLHASEQAAAVAGALATAADTSNTSRRLAQLEVRAAACAALQPTMCLGCSAPRGLHQHIAHWKFIRHARKSASVVKAG